MQDKKEQSPMRDLTLVRLTEDGAHLVLVSDTGEEFTLAADSALRAALTGGTARAGKVGRQMESTLRPRDIQARIRAGESPEAVADAAQTSVDRIMSYATPVLAERAHIAERAQTSSVRRKGGEGPSRSLGDAVAAQLRARNVDPDSVEWDAWRREDGRWTLVADYDDGDQETHRAEFLYDTPGRYVVPQDDEARWLIGERGATAETPLGDDAIGLVTPALYVEEPTIDLSDTLGAARARRHPEPAEPAADTGDADWMVTQATERPDRPSPSRHHPAPASVDEPLPVDEPETPAAETPAAETPAAETPAAEAPDQDQPGAEEKPKRAARKGRRAVPSWDEIMFGGGRSE